MNTLFILLRMNDGDYMELFYYAMLACPVLLLIIMFILIGISITLGQTTRQNETIIKLLKEKNTENTNTNQQDVPNNEQQIIGQHALPNSTGILVMGIISIAAFLLFFGIPCIILGIISLFLGRKAKEMYNANPGQYTLSSYKNMKAGYTCAIIGLSLSVLYLVYMLIVALLV